MKRTLLWFLVIIVTVSMTVLGIGCKEEVSTPEEVEETTEEVEETTEEVEETTEEDIFSEPTELTFWWYGEEEVPGLTNYIDAVCADYNELHPNITVTPVHQSVDVVVPNFLAAAEAQSGPDIATMWFGLYMMEQVWAGNIAPISDYVDEEEMSHWIGKYLSEYDGKVWGSDIFAVSFPLAYYKDDLIDVEVDPENPFVTWDEFLEVSGKLKDAGYEPMAAGFSGGWQFPVFANSIMPQFATYDEVRQAIVGEKSFTDPEFLGFFEILDEYNKAGYFMETATSIDYVDSWFEWRSGKATFANFTSVLALQWTEELGEDKVGITKFPQLTDAPMDWVPTMAISQFITSWSPNKELAADFLVFLHSDKSFDRMVEHMQGTTIPVDDRFDPSVIEDPLRRSISIDIIDGVTRGTVLVEAVIPYAPVGEGMIPLGQLMMLGDATPQEAAEAMEAAVEEWRTLNPEVLASYKILADLE